MTALGSRARALVLASTALLCVAAGAALSAVPSAAAQAPAAEPASAPRAAARVPLTNYAGVPARWKPRRVLHRDLVVRRAGAVIEDVRVYGDILVEARNVTLRRVDVVGGRIDNNWSTSCQNGLRIIRSTVRRAPGERTSDQDLPAIGTGGYLARRVAIRGTAEGFRVGGDSAGCGRVAIIDSFARVVAPDRCNDWHGDGLQGYDGPPLVIRNVRLSLVESRGCYGTSAFFYPAGQGNTSADIRGLRVWGGGYPFRLGTRGTVRGLGVFRGSWGYGPYDVACDNLSSWRANLIGGGRAPRAIACRTNGGY